MITEQQYNDLLKQLQDMENKIKELEDRRIQQSMILPDVVKSRHIGEGVRFVRGGLATSIPTNGESVSYGSPIYFETDTGKLKIWDGTQWLEVTLS